MRRIYSLLFVWLCSVLLLFSGMAQASCSDKPSAATFFKFMKEVKKNAHQRGDTLLKASAINKECKPVFELKILDAHGRVINRYYDAVTYKELYKPKPVLNNNDRDKSDSSSGGGRSSSRDDDDDDDNDDDDD